MKLILNVQQTEALEYCDEASYALVYLNKEDVALMAKRIKLWAAVATEDKALYQLAFWDNSFEVFGHCDEMEEIAENFEYGEVKVKAPDDFVIPDEDIICRIEGLQMVISGTLPYCDIRWNCLTKFTGIVAETISIRLSDICEMMGISSPGSETLNLEESTVVEPVKPVDMISDLVDALLDKISKED